MVGAVARRRWQVRALQSMRELVAERPSLVYDWRSASSRARLALSKLMYLMQQQHCARGLSFALPGILVSYRPLARFYNRGMLSVPQRQSSPAFRPLLN